MLGVNGVLNRIGELNQQLGITPPASTETTDGTSFATALADAGTTGTPDGGGGPSGDDVVASAKKYLGTPYVFGGTDPAKGLDCSALVQRAYRDLGVELPRNSWQQAKVGTKVDNLAAAQPGDILAFNTPVDHVAIYLGDNKMIAPPNPGAHVKTQWVYEPPTPSRRVLAREATAAVSAAATAGVNPAAAARPAALQQAGGLAGVPY